VSKLEAIVEELKTLPPQRLEQAADYIHRLHTGVGWSVRPLCGELPAV
jgi:hypothetical protein